MFKQLSNKRKAIALTITAFLMLILCYWLSYSKAITEYRKYQKNIKTSQGLTADETQYALLQSKNQLLSGLINKFVLDTFNYNNSLLSIAGDYGKYNNIQVKEYKPLPVQQIDSLKVFSRSLTVEGGFTDCLLFLYQLETKEYIGHISSVDFRTYTEPADKKTILLCTIIVQNIII